MNPFGGDWLGGLSCFLALSREAGSSETPEGLRQAVPGGIGRGG